MKNLQGTMAVTSMPYQVIGAPEEGGRTELALAKQTGLQMSRGPKHRLPDLE